MEPTGFRRMVSQQPISQTNGELGIASSSAQGSKLAYAANVAEKLKKIKW